ncbi:hypothetical protein TEA_022287 [Camellia sinensis var. sinensis]|uniref:ribose-phosphate diphosphokinase n=1 Tax=Camellia sinensis var. sinensis TaxID=542762 RepID=A0A4S4DHW8_CAMSN|nr:hypothetical protein TEA_022287 [Camellia sinensis var. sinensis]
MCLETAPFAKIRWNSVIPSQALESFNLDPVTWIETNCISKRCNLTEPLKFKDNGKPSIPVLDSEQATFPSFLASNYLEANAFYKNDTRLRIFSGTANPALSQEIACYMGLELGKIKIKRFADGEIYVQLQESVRGCDVYLVQPTCPPANENLMELLIMIDACRRASAKNITAVIPYFGYARADRKTQGRESIAAKLVANLITEAGADRVLACDLHSGQSMGYFDIPVDHVHGQPVILDYLASKTICYDDLVVVSPDVGGVARARAFAKKLSDAPLAIVDKRRHGHNVAEVMNLIGDVRGKVAVMVDDMIDTAGTISKGAALLHQEGAREVYACSTHAVFSPPAIERLSSGLFQEVIITNTIPVLEQNYFPQLTVLSVANLLGETIWRVHDDCSIDIEPSKGVPSKGVPAPSKGVSSKGVPESSKGVPTASKDEPSKVVPSCRRVHRHFLLHRPHRKVQRSKPSGVWLRFTGHRTSSLSCGLVEVGKESEQPTGRRSHFLGNRMFQSLSLRNGRVFPRIFASFLSSPLPPPQPPSWLNSRGRHAYRAPLDARRQTGTPTKALTCLAIISGTLNSHTALIELYCSEKFYPVNPSLLFPCLYQYVDKTSLLGLAQYS